MTCRIEGGITFKQDYNAENRISAIHKMNGNCSTGTVTESWLYAYDGMSSRVTMAHYTGVTQDSLTSYYMGGAYEVTGSAVKKYYSMAGQTIMRDSDGSLKYLLTDHLGSTNAVLDANGTLLSQQRYLPFGEVRTDTNPPYVTQTDLTYTGQRNLDDDVGLMDYKFRFYSPTLGRFISPDNVIPDASNPQMWNRYSYVRNNPIIYSDPTGHFPWFLAAVMVLGAVILTSDVPQPSNPAATALPDWWSPNPREKSHIYVEGYGYFDTGHINRGYDTAAYLFKKAKELGQDGGEIPMGEGDFNLTYTLPPNLSGDPLTEELYEIYTDYEYAYEEHQLANWNPSGFSPEDLPSDHLGFWAYANDLDKNEIPALLESLGEVSRVSGVDALLIAFGSTKNYGFLPMGYQKVNTPRGPLKQLKNVPWPSWLEME